ncbi:hypothetical protein K470DRAFT_262007 [Piedraia hortae CBS 480.64]|uniref:Uncharacterized protein n=1 Tax=Piedraia hortae CBS 480.64 TaxID=1314780 RepID=A0A6A7C801_9PEZI|nr:hypothetical protein K470DRAFT_262007 [Piedraia hortae CBS 480.64]
MRQTHYVQVTTDGSVPETILAVYDNGVEAFACEELPNPAYTEVKRKESQAKAIARAEKKQIEMKLLDALDVPRVEWRQNGRFTKEVVPPLQPQPPVLRHTWQVAQPGPISPGQWPYVGPPPPQAPSNQLQSIHPVLPLPQPTFHPGNTMPRAQPHPDLLERSTAFPVHPQAPQGHPVPPPAQVPLAPGAQAQPASWYEYASQPVFPQQIHGIARLNRPTLPIPPLPPLSPQSPQPQPEPHQAPGSSLQGRIGRPTHIDLPPNPFANIQSGPTVPLPPNQLGQTVTSTPSHTNLSPQRAGGLVPGGQTVPETSPRQPQTVHEHTQFQASQSPSRQRGQGEDE